MSNTLANRFPSQRISYAKKAANDFQWGKDTMDAGISRHYHFSNIATSHPEQEDYARQKTNYDLFNNVINQEDFRMDVNPLGLDFGQFLEDVKAYNKCPNKIRVMLGEELKRPFNTRALLVNSEGIKSRLKVKDDLIHEFLAAKLETIQLEAQSQVQGLPEEEAQAQMQEIMDSVMDPDTIESYMNTSYLQSVEILANKILSYLTHQQDIRGKRNDSFKHALLSGKQVLWVGVEREEATVKVINSLSYFGDKAPETKYIESGRYGGHRMRIHATDALESMGDFLTSAQIKKIEERSLTSKGSLRPHKSMRYPDSSDHSYYNSIDSNYEASYGRPNSTEDHVTVYNMEWRSQQKVGFLTFTNEFGDVETDIVSEEFKVPSYAVLQEQIRSYNRKAKVYHFDNSTLEWKWVPRVWTGVRIDDDIYTQMGVKPYQNISVESPYKAPLGYHGLIYSNMNAPAISMMDRMKPFQYLYFVVVHKLKRLIARDRGMVFHLDATMIPENLGMEKALYYMEEMGLDIYNPLQNAELPGAANRSKVTSSTSLSNMQDILNYVNLMNAIDQQIAEVAGVTQQREGQTSPQETVSNNQSAIMQSTNITEVEFQLHTKVWANAMDTLLSTAIQLYKEKPTLRQFILDDLSIATLDIMPEKLHNADMGIFVADSTKENEVFSNLKSLSTFLANSDKARFSDLIKLFKATSVQELEQQVEETERTMQEEAAQAAQQQQAQFEAQLQADQARIEDEQAHEKELALIDRETKITLKEIDSFKFQQDQDINNNRVPDQLEIEKLRVQASLKKEELQLKREEMESKERIENKKVSSKAPSK